MKNKKIFKALHTSGVALFTLTVLILIAYLIYAGLCSRDNKIPYVFGKAVLYVETPSMEPSIPVQSYILVSEPDGTPPDEGDIITFKSRNTVI